MSAKTIYESWLSNCPEFEAELKAMSEEQIEDCFKGDLKFGTAGLRGIMGAGTNRMNEYVVRRASQGLAMHLAEKCEEPSAVISYDSRNNSRFYAEETARVLAANGVKTYIFKELNPVPVLSFAVRYLNCDCGIMVTASHNSREYNGYKVYGSDGGQVLEEDADNILRLINTVDMFNGVKMVDFKPSPSGQISYVFEAVYAEYMKNMSEATAICDEKDVKILYTPLNGSGLKPCMDMFTICGFDVDVVEEQRQPDGDFPTCTYPNPEKPETYNVALSLAKDHDIIVATDPDCDRVGCMAKHGEDYVLLSGNDIGTIFTYYMCNMEGSAGKAVVSSLVSTPLIDAIAKDCGVEVRRTLVGFKYIGEQINLLGENFLLGFEESNGYLTGTYARDKDGVAGTRMLCTLAAYYKKQGKTLVDVLNEIQAKYGTCINKTISIETEGGPLMKRVRASELPGAIDYIGGINGLPKADIVQVNYEDGSRLIIRPSGTEPKVKLYVSAGSEERISEIVEEIEKITA